MSKVGISDAEMKKIQRKAANRVADQLTKTLAVKKQAYCEAVAQVRESLCVQCARTHGISVSMVLSGVGVLKTSECLLIANCAMELEETQLLHYTIGNGITSLTLMQLRSELHTLENEIKHHRRVLNG